MGNAKPPTSKQTNHLLAFFSNYRTLDSIEKYVNLNKNIYVNVNVIILFST
ncbi:hypothetical protein BACI349Y_630007 [Bacillus sp. 349Y]|nr:hypothetical protein BACI349Y_630007 [Bacillus sp. 349Y]